MRLGLLAWCILGAWSAASAQGQSPDEEKAPRLRSTIQATGIGIVSLKPTILRLSVPIKVVSDTAWDATENLRSVRRTVVERANEMGVVQDSLQVFGFQCGPEQQSPISSIRGESGNPKFEAKCFFVADFPLREGQDHEETLGRSQAQLEQLTSLLPRVEPGRRSYSVSTLTSGLTGQQLENPLALFVAKVSDDDRAEAFKMALESAQLKVGATLDALGIEAESTSISQSPSYSSIRPMHPLESMLDSENDDEVIGTFVDGVSYTVRLTMAGIVNDKN